MRADRVWLLKHTHTDEKGNFFIAQIEKNLKNHNIEIKKTQAERTDLFDNLRAFHQIILEEKPNSIFVNVSVGSKIQAIASMMACMMFKDFGMIKPYYAEPNEYMSISKEQETIGLKDIKLLPEYKIEIPKQNLIKCMVLIDKQKNGKVTKKNLKDLALKENLIHVGEKKTETAAYMALKNLIEPLQNWNFIEIEKIGTSNIVSLSEDGKNALRFLNP
jgi:hypothetical protein